MYVRTHLPLQRDRSVMQPPWIRREVGAVPSEQAGEVRELCSKAVRPEGKEPRYELVPLSFPCSFPCLLSATRWKQSGLKAADLDGSLQLYSKDVSRNCRQEGNLQSVK